MIPTSSADYGKLIDSQTWAFIKRTENAFPVVAVTAGIEEQRNHYDAMCAIFLHPHPPGVTTHNTSITATDHHLIPLRRYTPVTGSANSTEALVLYLHGGGFVVGSLESHDDICAEICDRMQSTVCSIDYRLSPEHKHPAALDDVIDVLKHLSGPTRQPIVLCGDSAGANLAAAACHKLRQQSQQRNNPSESTSRTPYIMGQVLIYPGLGGDITRGSYLTHAHAPMLTTQDVLFYSDVRCAPHTRQDNPDFAPLRDNDFTGLPPTVIFSAECDPLCDDGKEYCQRIQQANSQAYWFLEHGLVHGYLRARHSVDRARESFSRIIEALNALIDNRWPYA